MIADALGMPITDVIMKNVKRDRPLAVRLHGGGEEGLRLGRQMAQGRREDP